MVSGHPNLYQVVGLVCCVLLVVHAAWAVIAGGFAFIERLGALRNAVLLVMVQWFVQWYAAAYRRVENRLLLEK